MEFLRHVFVIVCAILLSACVRGFSSNVAGVPVVNLSRADGCFYSIAYNKNNKKMYTGWSHKGPRYARVKALRLCHSDTNQYNVCRIKRGV